MRKLPGLFLFLFFVQITSLYSQESAIYTYPLKDFDKAISLYEDQQYASAQIIFKKVKKLLQLKAYNRIVLIILPIAPFVPIRIMPRN